MKIDRRSFAIAGAAIVGAGKLLRAAPACAADDAAVTQAVEALRKAVFGQNKADLDKLSVEQLSYGHSSAVVQNKAEFINGVMNRKGTLKSLAYPDLKVTMAGSNAIARHRYVSESEQDGKTTNIDIGILEVWTTQDGGWKLLARQGFKLPA
ncbi:MAG TPA: nuclear transport factor 2 family protein [Stellaceae bacterium]|nr:nuclear transport factor 2 family protein [Stellaceae bacterium]